MEEEAVTRGCGEAGRARRRSGAREARVAGGRWKESGVGAEGRCLGRREEERIAEATRRGGAGGQRGRLRRRAQRSGGPTRAEARVHGGWRARRSKHRGGSRAALGTRGGHDAVAGQKEKKRDLTGRAAACRGGRGAAPRRARGTSDEEQPGMAELWWRRGREPGRRWGATGRGRAAREVRPWAGAAAGSHRARQFAGQSSGQRHHG